jgi:nitroreductase
MDFVEVVRRRRMVRSFTDAPVPVESVERILDIARRGPSAGYSQGVEFVVVTNERERTLLGQGFERVASVSGHHNFIAQAQVLILICTSADIYKRRYREPDKMRVRGGMTDDDLWSVPYWYTDAGCGLMLMLLAAVNEGLGAAFIGFGPAASRVRDHLGVPHDYEIVGAVLLGYEAADARDFGDVAADPRPRRSLREIVHRERW